MLVWTYIVGVSWTYNCSKHCVHVSFFHLTSHLTHPLAIHKISAHLKNYLEMFEIQQAAS